MTQPQQPYPPPTAPAVPPASPVPPPARQRSALPWLLALVGTLALLCCGGGAAATLVLTDGSPTQVARDPTTPPGGSAPPAGSPPGTDPGPGAPPGPPTLSPGAGTPAAPVPEDVTYTGRGNRTVALSLPADLRHTASITHRGSTNFVVWSLDRTGRENGLVVNAIGRYSGVRPLDFELAPAALRIEADGAWSITVRAFTKTPLWSGESSGSDPTVLRLDPARATGAVRARVTHTGDSNVVVIAYAQQTPTLLLQSLLVNDIGRYSADISLPPGTVAVAIDAEGPWTISRG